MIIITYDMQSYLVTPCNTSLSSVHSTFHTLPPPLILLFIDRLFYTNSVFVSLWRDVI